LQWPVISVGSISAGGAGKTPVVIALAGVLRDHGWHVDVLSRGYGRKGNEPARVALSDPLRDAGQFGDEPVLIAERTGVPVWVGADRFAAGELAEQEQQAAHKHRRAWRDRSEPAETRSKSKEFPAQEPEVAPVCVHLLDDGFQHRRLARNFDIVVLTAAELEDVLLPAGNLREPLAALQRADAIVLREEEREEIEESVRALVPAGVPIWSVRRKLRFPGPLGVFSAGLRPVAFCGVARPEGFAAMLAEAGCGVVETIAFRDHHAYTPADADRVLEIARKLDATGLITTEKDAVKLTPPLRERLAGAGSLAVVALEADFVYKAPVVRALETRLQTETLQAPKRDAAPHPREARLQ
jgi:tetraacyldisaccharide 4'-kinase